EGGALEQRATGRAGRVAAGEHDAGDGGNRRRVRRGQAGEQDVWPVTGNEDERPVDEVVDEVVDAHGGDANVPHLPLRGLACVEEEMRVQLGGDLRDRRAGELAVLWHDVHGSARVPIA